MSGYVLTIYNTDTSSTATTLPTALANYIQDVVDYRFMVYPAQYGESDSFCLASDIYKRWKDGDIT